MNQEILLELRTLAAWVTVGAVAWYLLRLGVGISLALLGARRGSEAIQRCGVRLVPRGIRPHVARWAAAPALGLGLAVLGSPGMAASTDCATAGLPPLDRSDICIGQPRTGGPVTPAFDDPQLASAIPTHTGAEEPDDEPEGLTVRAGDSLWSLTAASLGTTSADHIAASWPELYRKNQAAIGPDPGIIHPGMILQTPAGWAGADR